MKIADIGSSGREPSRSYRSSSEPPDQNASSNEAAWARSRRIRIIFSKMIDQHQNEARTKISITIFTRRSACWNNAQTDRSVPTDPASATELTAVDSMS